MGRLLVASLMLAGCVSEPAATPGTVLLSDRGANAILAYDAETGAFEGVFASGHAQRVDRPAEVVVSPAGDLFMAGFGQGDIVQFGLPSGTMMGVFFSDSRVLEEPTALLFRGDELFVLGNDTANVVVLDAAGRRVHEVRTPSNAHDMVLAPDGRTIYVSSDADDGAIVAIDIATERRVRTFAPAEEVASATSIALAPDGTLLACDWERDQVLRYDPLTGALLDVVVAQGSGTLRIPVALDVGPDGALYVLDEDGVQRLDLDSGEKLGTLIVARDGHNVRPRAFRFLPAEAGACAPTGC